MVDIGIIFDEKDLGNWHWELHPLTFGRTRLVWTDGDLITQFW